jgi:RNA polymerase subunit RPABC4/transcription elongation factor Spt4
MKKKVCEACRLEIEDLAKFCNWCGHGPKLRKGGMTQRVCSECKQIRSSSFSYCPWCAEDFDGDEKPRQIAKGSSFNSLRCPSCKGAILKSMEYCPWCCEDLTDNGSKKACPSCSASIKNDWQHCIYCGSFTRRSTERSAISFSDSLPIGMRRPSPLSSPTRPSPTGPNCSMIRSSLLHSWTACFTTVWSSTCGATATGFAEKLERRVWE